MICCFQPVLCYLEGMWTEADSKGKIDEPFASDRHSIDASSFFELQVCSYLTWGQLK